MIEWWHDGRVLTSPPPFSPPPTQLVLAFGFTQPFSIPPRFDVYASMDSPARPLALRNGGDPSGLEAVEAAIAAVAELNMLNSLYDMMHGINLLFFAARLLKLSDFQPRLGLVTKTIARCGRDLAHYLGVLAFLFGVASIVAHLVFGGVVTQFSTLGHTFQIVFNMLVFADGGCASSGVHCAAVPHRNGRDVCAQAW